MNIEKWIEENSELIDNCFSGERLIHPESIKELLKTHAIVPREPSDEFCKSVNRQSCTYLSDMKVRTMMKFIIKASDSGHNI